MPSKFLYAVARGRQTGIFMTWGEAKKHVDGFNGARYKKFTSREDAETFIRGNGSLILGQFGITDVVPTTAPTLNLKVSPHSSDALVIFTDGACKGNGSAHARAGYAAVFPNHPHHDISERLEGDVKTNNRAEFMACIRGLEICEKEDPGLGKTVHMYTDSQLLLNTVTKWMKGWKNNKWMKADENPVLNLDLVVRLDKLSMRRKIDWRWVPAHTGRDDWISIWNARADEMADKACA
jgi:ribonuclease HI